LRKDRWYEPDFQSFVVSRMVDIAKEYKDMRWWGEKFYKWFIRDQKPYNSFGNGSAMRVSSVGWIAESEEEVKHFSRLVTEVSHNHPEGLKGAEAVAMAIYLGRTGHPMDEIRKRMEAYYPKISSMTVDKIRPSCEIDTQGKFITCQVSVPQAIVCFLEATSFEDAVRNAISLGGDADTQAAIAGSMAEAYFGVPYELEDEAIEFLPSNNQNHCMHLLHSVIIQIQNVHPLYKSLAHLESEGTYPYQAAATQPFPVLCHGIGCRRLENDLSTAETKSAA
jgi:type I restriction enzyme M protein